MMPLEVSERLVYSCRRHVRFEEAMLRQLVSYHDLMTSPARGEERSAEQRVILEKVVAAAQQLRDTIEALTAVAGEIELYEAEETHQ